MKMSSPHVMFAQAKLERAVEHIREFDRLGKEFFEAGSFVERRERTKEGSQTLFRLIADVKQEYPDKHRVVFDVAVHLMRSLCDNLFAGLLEQHPAPSGVTTRSERSHAFPIVLHRTPPKGGGEPDFASWRRHYSWLDPGLLQVIEDAQPFNIVQRGNQECQLTTHPLSVLHELNNINKHRVPVRKLCTNLKTEVKVFRPEGSIVDGERVVTPHSLVMTYTSSEPHEHTDGRRVVRTGYDVVDGFVLAEVPIQRSDPPLQLWTKHEMYACIDRNSPVAAGEPALPLLWFMRSFVRDNVIAKLKPFFA